MELTGSMGGGIMLALAAGLWLVYLVPSWLRRREYLATERNAVRLQQTLRVLAETAEIPVAIRAETSARGVAQQERTLRAALQQQAREARAIDAAARARDAAARRQAARIHEAQPAIAAVVSARRLAARRLRRTRAFTSLLLLASLVTLLVQGSLMLSSGIAPGALAVLGFSSVGVLTTFSMLGRLAAVSRSRSAQVSSKAPARRTSLGAAPVTQQAPTWTPVPIPKPLYLSRAELQGNVVVEAAVAVAELQAAAAEADRALRSAQASPEVIPLVERGPLVELVETSPTQTPRRLANLDLDEVLRRRRAAG